MRILSRELRRGRWRKAALWAGCTALVAGGLTAGGAGAAAMAAADTASAGPAAAAQAAAASAACSVNYSVSSNWGSGFGVQITITNLGPAITSWNLQYSYAGAETLSSGWNGTWTQSGKTVSVASESWNGSLATNGSTGIGANFNLTGSIDTPTAFTLNGVACSSNTGGSPSASPTTSASTTPTSTATGTGTATASPSTSTASASPTSTGTTPPAPCTVVPGSSSSNVLAPSVSLVSPTAGEIFSPGSNISIQAAACSSGSISSVTYYASTGPGNNTEIGVSTSSPWAVQWANVAAGNYSVTAVATDNLGQSTTSYPIAISVEGPTIIVNPTVLTVAQGTTATVGVALSSQPSTSVTVAVAQSGDSDLSISGGSSLTFTTANWNVAQQVSVTSGSTSADVGAAGTITASATGYTSGKVAVTEAQSGSGYNQWFLNLYDDIKNPANGYFSPKGIPYHSVETLIVEAPDYGHETTSETYSYWIWLEADYGRVTGNWTPFVNAWTNMETYMIPNDANQPGQCSYNPSSPATYGPEEPAPSNYPVALNSSVPVGSDPLSAELKSAYGNCDMYQPMWIMDTDNRYGFGQQEDGTSTPSWVNSYQRGAEESVWDTVPQPDWDTMTKYGSSDGFLNLFNNGGGNFAAQYKYTDAPDADARMVQAAFWADTYAKAQGKTSSVTATTAKAAKLGDFLRYSMFDKYFKQISSACSQDGSVSCPAGTSKANEDTYLLSWYDAWGGSTTGAWSWRISGTEIHEGYQNPLAAYALSTDSDLLPLSPTAKGDWATSLTTQLNLYSWLQSSEGAIAGGVTNSWGGNYGDVSKPPSGDTTFDGMYYDPEPEYHNPPSNQWFGYQTWPMERLAEYYYETGNTQAQSILAKWIAWAESVTTVTPGTGTLLLPSTLTWSGQPGENWTTGTSSSSQPPANTGLHVTATGTDTDIGVAASLAKVYEYYAAKSGDTTAKTAAQNIIDIIHKYYGDSIGYTSPETRTDYTNFTTAYNTTNYEGVYFPSGWTGTYPGGIKLSSATNTFLSIRPWYVGDPQWSKVATYLGGGSAPVFDYHRFWAEGDVATAFDAFAYLFPTVQPPSGF
ncbi:MAG TPA: glycoside hydrolase family 48 protein [Actinospica sp.]|nr:glycoside hydrolase family 48 protein [Actinospica sp.]